MDDYVINIKAECAKLGINNPSELLLKEIKTEAERLFVLKEPIVNGFNKVNGNKAKRSYQRTGATTNKETQNES